MAPFSAPNTGGMTNWVGSFYGDRLEETQSKVEKAGGRIVKPIFAFPGGRRFHFAEPSGNEFGVWGEAGRTERPLHG